MEKEDGFIAFLLVCFRDSLTLSPRLKSSSRIMAHCNLNLLGSMESHYIARAGLKLLASSNPSASASLSARITGRTSCSVIQAGVQKCCHSLQQLQFPGLKSIRFCISKTRRLNPESPYDPKEIPQKGPRIRLTSRSSSGRNPGREMDQMAWHPHNPMGVWGTEAKQQGEASIRGQ
ncbi:hypothetical protein AAY473_014231, partial [Plecturocebus cupreus]